MKTGQKVYIGDGVYACFERSGQLKVTTSNGIKDTNVIFFDSEAWSALVRFVSESLSAGEADREE